MKSKIVYYLPLSLLFIFCFVYFLWPSGQEWISYQVQTALENESGWSDKVVNRCKKLIPLQGNSVETDTSEWFRFSETLEENCFISVNVQVHRNLALNLSGNSTVAIFSRENNLIFSKVIPLFLLTPLAIAPLLVFLFSFFFRIYPIPVSFFVMSYLLTLYGLDLEELMKQAALLERDAIFFRRDFWILIGLTLWMSVIPSTLRQVSRFLSAPFGILKPTILPILFLARPWGRKPYVRFVFLQTLILFLSYVILKIRLLGIPSYLRMLVEDPPYFTVAFLVTVILYFLGRKKKPFYFVWSKIDRSRFNLKTFLKACLVINAAYLIPELINKVHLIDSVITWFELRNSSSSFLKFFVAWFCQVSTGKYAFDWAFPNIAFNNVMLDANWIGFLFSPLSFFLWVPSVLSSIGFQRLYRLTWAVLQRPLLVVFLVYGVVEVTKIRILEPVVFAFIIFLILYFDLQKRNWKLSSSRA